MCGPNGREIGLPLKTNWYFSSFQLIWVDHWVKTPQAEKNSIPSQIEPFIITLHPCVSILPKSRFLFSRRKAPWSLTFSSFVKIKLHSAAPSSAAEHCALPGPSCAPFPSLHLRKKSGSLQALKSTQPLINFSLLCSENKLPVISLPLKSPALANMREICLCWVQSSTLRASAPLWVLPGETGQDGCAIHRWALVQHVRKLELEKFPPHEAPNVSVTEVAWQKVIYWLGGGGKNIDFSNAWVDFSVIVRCRFSILVQSCVIINLDHLDI